MRAVETGSIRTLKMKATKAMQPLQSPDQQQLLVRGAERTAAAAEDGRQDDQPAKEPVKSDVPDPKIRHGLFEQQVHGGEHARREKHQERAGHG